MARATSVTPAQASSSEALQSPSLEAAQAPSSEAAQASSSEALLQTLPEVLANKISALRTGQFAFARHTVHGGLFQFYVGEQELYRQPLASGLSKEEATRQALEMAHEKLSNWAAVNAKDIFKRTDNNDGSFTVVLKDASKYIVRL